jgi:Glycosyltransferase family 92
MLPYFVNCPVPNNVSIPKSVSITSQPCENAENNLKIIDNQPPDGVKKEFAVCTKPLTYNHRNFAIKLIEWIHIMRILGAEKIYISVRYLHPELNKVLAFFEKQNIIEVYPFLENSGVSTIKIDSPEDITLQVVSLNDCFHRNRNLYKYIVIPDTDEVIVPLKAEDMNWHDLLKSINRKADMHVFRMFFFHKKEKPIVGISDYFYTLYHVKVK